MYSWKRAFIYSCYLKELDGSGILGVVKFPKGSDSDGTLTGDATSAILTALNQQRIKDGRGPVIHDLPDGETEYVSPDSRFWSIPHLGYIGINKTVMGVECNGPDGKKNALQAVRKIGSKVSSFYLFESDGVSGVFSGSLGRMQFRLSATGDGNIWHLQIISY